MTYVNTCAEREHLGRGRYRHVQHIKPVAYQDRATLRAIDSRWQDSGIVGRPHLVSASRLLTSVADDGMRRIHPTREQDRYLEIGAPYVKVGGVWQKVGFAGATRSGNRITWHRPQADLTITHGGHFAKLDIALLGGYVPEDGLVAFPVGINGLTRKGGRILADGVPVMRLRAPVVTDADNPLTTRSIAGEFTSLAGQLYYLMRLPSLAGIGRPIIDPTLELQPDAAAGIDGGVRRDLPDNDFATQSTIDIGWGDAQTVMMKFDVSSIQAGRMVTEATLSVTNSAEVIWQTDTLTAHSILAANSGWVEGCTFNHANPVGDVHWAGSLGCATPGVDYNATALGTVVFPLSTPAYTQEIGALGVAQVQAWIEGENYGFRIGSLQPWAASWGLITSDHATAAYRPKLTIEYSEPTKQVFY